MSKDKDIIEKVKICHKILSWILAESMNESFLFFVWHNQLTPQFSDFPLITALQILMKSHSK